MNKYLLFFVLVSFLSCSKKNTPPVTVSNAPVQYGTPYTNIPATLDIVMYEVNERAYSAAGNFAGITQRLDSIKALGINVIWLMPINPIGSLSGGTHGSVKSPYCVKDFKAVNAEFGTLADLRTLVSEAHNKNMAVILDWAANQTAWDHPWITQHKSWYAQDGSGNIIIPQGTTYNDVAQLDFTNADMRKEMIKSMAYWVYTANIDGFRCDFANHVPGSFWAQAVDSLNNIPNHDLILLAEGDKQEQLTAGFQMNFAFYYYSTIKNIFSTTNVTAVPASAIFTVHNSEYYTGPLPIGTQKLRYTTNHDESAFNGTPMTVFGGKQGALAASVATMYMGGVPLIYGSQEVGTTSAVSFFYKTPINWSANPDMVAAYKKFISLRKNSPALKAGTLTTYADNDVICYTRKLGTDTFLIITNVRNSSKTFTVPVALQGSWVDAFDASNVTLSTTQNLDAYQYIVLKK